MAGTSNLSGHDAINFQGGNALLARVNVEDRARLAPSICRRHFAKGEILIDAGVDASAAYFIERGVASIVKPADGERTTEIALIGPEGFAGAAIITGDGLSPYRTFVQSDQLSALLVDAASLRFLFAESVSFRHLLLRAIEAQMIQIAENLVAALWQQTRARLARWLLMYRDRMRSDRLELTHEFIALMVGAQRSKITTTLHELEGDGAIVAHRGVIIVRDPNRLEELTCGSYSRHDVATSN